MHATNTKNPVDFPVTQQQKDIALAESLLEQVEELIEDFIRDNIDMDLDMDDMVEQFDTCREYIRKNLFKEAFK